MVILTVLQLQEEGGRGNKELEKDTEYAMGKNHLLLHPTSIYLLSWSWWGRVKSKKCEKKGGKELGKGN